MTVCRELEPLNEFVPVNWDTGSITMGSNTTVNTGTASITLQPEPYLIQASEWGHRAGRQWVSDLENHFAIRSVTCASTGCASSGWVTESESCLYYPPRELTPKQAAAEGRRQREGEYRRDRAGWKGQELLMANLTPGQREDYKTLGRFTVRTRRGHRYVIGKARNQNVVRLNRRGKPMRTLCVTVGGGVPIEDVMLGQKLMLDHDEDHFLKVARQWPVRLALGVGGLVRRGAPVQQMRPELFVGNGTLIEAA